MYASSALMQQGAEIQYLMYYVLLQILIIIVVIVIYCRSTLCWS
jgi:hypothetical protein